MGMDVSLLFLELSNIDRVRILKFLEGRKMKLSHIARELNFSVQETHRNLQRMIKVGLVDRDKDGSYYLTSFGQYILTLLPSFSFLCKHKDYFLTHDLTRIPRSFLERIGELARTRFAPDLFTAINLIEAIIREAEKYVLIITEHVLLSGIEMLSMKPPGIIVKIILPSRASLPRKAKVDNRAARRFNVRFLDSIDVALVQNEKRAGIAFPYLTGEIDYRGFLVEDEEGLSWCRDLFQYYWDKAKLIRDAV